MITYRYFHFIKAEYLLAIYEVLFIKTSLSHTHTLTNLYRVVKTRQYRLASHDGFSNKYTNILEMKDKQKHTLQTT